MKLLYVEWEDAVSHCSGNWSNRDDVEKTVPSVVKSVGWILTETDKYLTIFAHDGDNQVCGDMCIPKGFIKKRRVIRL